MEQDRPNPYSLLRRADAEERGMKRGRLKIFFGYAAGVGKTYAMLDAAHAAQKSGIDVVAGYIEPHTRPETLALLDGLVQLDPMMVNHKGIALREFDLDGAIRRAPQLMLVDELAHTNAEGCRHLKRYQDVDELLRAGIDVYTTVNVQHIESLNDIVASITGVVVRERIPDSVFDSADQVELVDIEPDDLIERLNKGKIYKEQQVQQALGNFFTKDNLISLREIALRRTADRVNRAAERVRAQAQQKLGIVSEHILICLSSSPSNPKVIRTAARMADAFHGSFTALFVETPNTKELSPQNLKTLRENLRLAEQMGARIATVYGEDIAYQICEYAKVSGISKIILGRSNTRKKFHLPQTSLVERLTQLAPNTDIYVIPDQSTPYTPKHPPRRVRAAFSVRDSVRAVLLMGLATLVGLLFYELGFSEANIITVYILGVLLTAMATDGKIYSVLSSVISVFVFNFFFTVPRFSFQAYDSGYPVTFLIMLAASLLISTLTTKVKMQAMESSHKAYRTELLLETSQKLQRAPGRKEIIAEASAQMGKLLDRPVLFYSVADGMLQDPLVFGNDENQADAAPLLADDERAVAQWVFRNNKRAGATTNTLPGAKALYLAVRSNENALGVVGIPIQQGESLDSFENNLLFAMLGECALALEKDQINETKNFIEMQARQEQLRANLLRAISHDLRTPLTSISGNAGVLMQNSSVLNDSKKMRLYTDIYDDAMWLINLVENLLSVTRIENGTMNIKMEPELLADVVAEAMKHINRRSAEYQMSVQIEDDLLMARMDSRLIVQVIINIVDNAIKYTPKGSQITIRAERVAQEVAVSIADDGNGISEEAKARLFDMFYTVDGFQADSRRGLGLGLALCKSIITAHGGTITVADQLPHGTVFHFTLPAQEVPIEK